MGGNTDVEDEDGDTKVQPDRPDSALDMCPIWTAIMIMLVIVVTKMFIVLMTRYNLTGWTQLLKCASPIFHPQHQVICEIARWLLPIMGRSGDQDTPTLKQKHQLATSYLQVLDRVLGELSKTRAKAIFELVDCALVLAIRDFEEDVIDTATLK